MLKIRFIFFKKHLHSFFFAPKQAFTLVELIVVISVLGVLATIAFTQVSNVTQSARNSTRMTNIQSISSSLNIYKATNWTYPIPDNKTDILYSGTTIGYQWYIKDTAARLLKLSPNTSQDPLNTSSYFSYATNASRTDAQILGFLEANAASFKVLPVTFASDELATKTPYSKGEELWILYTSWTTTPLTGTGIDLNATTNPYTAYYNSTDSLSWTGNLLQNLVISYAHGSGFGSPSTDDCPTGFIPVPWNKDFNQPGFCVAKYEMKQAIGDAGSYVRSGSLFVSENNHINQYCSLTTPCSSAGSRNFTNSVVSKADTFPLVNLSQNNAIEACKAMGTGYHLITDNEWMTIARNIEQVSTNWSTNLVWSGFIFQWHSDKFPNRTLPASLDDKDGYFQTEDIEIGAGDGAYNNYASNVERASVGQKRTLTLSNGQIIWDFAGNVWENVDKANTLGGEGYDSDLFRVSNACGAVAWFSFYGNDGMAQCSYQNGYSYAVNWPLIPSLNATNGIGRICSYSTVKNVFLRGGGWYSGDYSWVFSLSMDGWNTTANPLLGFRCAK